MPYGQNDPATDRRISRLSLISSAVNFYAGKTADPAVPLATAKEWEEWVYPQDTPTPVSNGTATSSVPLCAECSAALTPVNFKKGNSWPVDQLASQGLSKYGKVLCKTHYSAVPLDARQPARQEASDMSLSPSFARVITRAEQARQHPGQLHGLLTGLPTLDRRLRGLSGLILCGARPSMGKTTFVQTVIKNVCEESVLSGTPRTVGFLSAEMNQDDLARRWLCMSTNVRAEDLDTGRLSQQDIVSLRQASARMERWPLLIEARRSPDLTFVTDTFRKWSQEAGTSLSLIVIDHMGEITCPGTTNDYWAQTQVATMLSNASEELGVPILAAAQLSRKVEDRENKRPQLSDFRDSGKIEEKAESALLLYRKAYYDAQAQGQEVGTAPMEIIIAKGRNTGTGSAMVDFVPDYPRIEPHTNGALPRTI